MKMLPGLLLSAGGIFCILLGWLGSPILFNTGHFEARMTRIEAIQLCRRIVICIGAAMIAIGTLLVLHKA
jgi:hypothetical protein